MQVLWSIFDIELLENIENYIWFFTKPLFKINLFAYFLSLTQNPDFCNIQKVLLVSIEYLIWPFSICSSFFFIIPQIEIQCNLKKRIKNLDNTQTHCTSLSCIVWQLYYLKLQVCDNVYKLWESFSTVCVCVINNHFFMFCH